MIADRIRIVPFELERIITCDIIKRVNEHGRAVVRGYMDSEKERDYMDHMSQDMPVRIEAIDEDGECSIIFSGIIDNIKIKNTNHLLELELSLVTPTSLMDIKPAVRAFQTPSMPYQQIFDIITGLYPAGGCIMSEGEGAVTDNLIVQYRETDWEFLKRLASHLNTVVIPSFTTEGPKCYVGVTRWSGVTKAEPVFYESCKLVRDYLHKQQNQVEGLIEEDGRCYQIQEPQILELGAQVEFQERIYYVAEAESHLNGHQLENCYLIKTAAGFRVPRMNNDALVGAAVDGVVTDVKEAVVKVHLNPDAAEGDTRWLPFSTVYSSPDGSGWYCMPEKGDEIRLYFPTVKEKHAYVISSVHLPGNVAAGGVAAGTASECRCDPNKKTIITESKKMVQMDETYILLTNNNGLSVLLDDTDGIIINSSGSVSIRSDASVMLTGNAGIEMSGTQEITLKQGKSSVKVSESKVVLSGAEVRMQ